MTSAEKKHRRQGGIALREGVIKWFDLSQRQYTHNGDDGDDANEGGKMILGRFVLCQDCLPERTLEKRSGVPVRRQSEALSPRAMDLFQKTHIKQVFTTHAYQRTYRHAAPMLR